jgi:hypothetical protein
MLLNKSATTFGRVLMITVLVFSMGLLTACGGQSTETTTTSATSYIARIEGAPESARIGIVVENGKFAVYVCSLDDAFNLTSARWYSGDVGADGSVQGVSPDGVQFQGKVSGDTFSGTLINTAQQTLTFSGTAIPAGGPAGLYRGLGNYGGQEVVVGSVIDTDGSFASTVQYKGKIEFVTPVASEPQPLDNTSLNVAIGNPSQQMQVLLVTTLEGVPLSQLPGKNYGT